MKKLYALIDISPVIRHTNGEINHIQTAQSAMKVLGVYATAREAGEASTDAWDCSGKQELHVVEVEVTDEKHLQFLGKHAELFRRDNGDLLHRGKGRWWKGKEKYDMTVAGWPLDEYGDLLDGEFVVD